LPQAPVPRKAEVPIMPKDQSTLTPQEVARELKWPVRSIYALIRSGKMRAVKDTGRWKIPADEIDKRRGK
jgi:excisionase family DNA binding protein